MKMIYPEPMNRRLRREHYRLAHQVIERDGRFCRMCGANESCFCPIDEVAIALTICLIIPRCHGGRVSADNLRTVCSTCAEGLIGLRRDPYCDE